MTTIGSLSLRPNLRLWLALALLLIGGAIAGWFFTRHAPPSITRMLPDSDSIAYADVGLIRRATHFDERWDLEHDAGYDEFTGATGIDVKRDLSEAALAIAGDPQDRRYSEVMRGKFDRRRLESWLKAHQSAMESYAGRSIYTVTHEGRPDRICIVDDDTVIGSNTATANEIHQMLDRSKHSGTPPLLRTYFGNVPKATPLWWVRKYNGEETPTLTLGDQSVTLGMPRDVALVLSLRYVGTLEARALAITASEEQAQRTEENWNAALHLARSLGKITKARDPAQQVLSSAVVVRDGVNVSATTTVSRQALEELAHSLQEPAQR